LKYEKRDNKEKRTTSIDSWKTALQRMISQITQPDHISYQSANNLPPASKTVEENRYTKCHKPKKVPKPRIPPDALYNSFKPTDYKCEYVIEQVER
jgi:hypothetical protein